MTPFEPIVKATDKPADQATSNNEAREKLAAEANAAKLPDNKPPLPGIGILANAPKIVLQELGPHADSISRITGKPPAIAQPGNNQPVPAELQSLKGTSVVLQRHGPNEERTGSSSASRPSWSRLGPLWFSNR
jgi:hypothetical protein